MSSRQFIVADLEVDGTRLSLTEASLVAVRRGLGDTDWEIVANCRETPDIRRGVHDVVVEGIDPSVDAGSVIVLKGRAVVVRQIDRTVVLRGEGDPDGLDW